MRVFMTGASGWIGSAVVPELLGNGHEVVGLARSDESANALSTTGAEVYRGSLDDPSSLREGVERCDGVVHLGYNHDFSRMQEAAESDRAVLETFRSVLRESERPLVVAGGVLGLAPGRVATENDQQDPSVHPRVANGVAVLAMADEGIRSSCVRFAPTVHGEGDHGFIATLIAVARAKEVSAYVGDGSNRWPAVHRLDAARLVRLSLESAPGGTALHAVAEPGIPAKEIAEAIGAGLGVPVVSVSGDEVMEHFGWIGRFFSADTTASNTITRELLHWDPTHQGLLVDLAEGHYFNG